MSGTRVVNQAMHFSDSHLGQLRKLVGSRLLRVPGTRIVIENADGDVLLQHRSDFANWGLPGGSGELGESVEDTIRREVAEETGLVLGAILPCGYASDPEFEVITFPNGDTCHFHSLIFTTTEFSGRISTADNETLQLDWFAPDVELPMLPNMKRTLEAFMLYKSTGAFQLI